MLLSALGLFAQYNVSISGTVSTPSGDPVENVEITLFTDSLGGFFYYNTMQTAADGTYSDNFDSPVTQGNYTVLMENCNTFEMAAQSYYPGNYNAVIDFTYCEITQDTCSVSIQSTPAGALAAIPSGTSPYTYAWNTGETTDNIFPNQDGTYCVTITAANGCTASACFTVMTGGQDSCWVDIFQSPNGPITADASGIAPFTYAWSTGETTQNIFPQGDTLYCVTVTDAVGCVAFSCIDLWDNPVDTTACFVNIVYPPGGGSLLASGSGAEPISYVWNTGETTAEISPTETGEYCVTMTDAEGCTASACIWHYEGGGGQDSCSVFIDIVSQGNSSVDLQAFFSGVAPSTYAWSTGDTLQTITVSGSGTYCITMTDATGCTSSDCFTFVTNDNYDIGGIIYLQDSIPSGFLSGWVYLYEMTAVGTELVDSVVFSSTPNSLPSYLFEEVPQGDYIVKGELNPDSDGYDEHAPTYHWSTTWWNEATVISIPNADDLFDHILFVETDGFGGGQGEVNGIVQQLDGWVVNEDPMPNISVMIMDEFENLLGHMKTDAQGRFKFEGLDWGTYKVGIEITGLPQAFYLVTLSPDNPTVANITFDVNNDEITVTETLNIILTESDFEIMPNPVSDNLNIQLDLREANNLQIQLMHVSGQVLRQESLNLGIGQQNIKWNVANLPSGIYFINLKKDQDVISKKFIKKQENK